MGPPQARLLAVDLGLRLGWAHFGADGELTAFGSRHVANRTALKALAWAMVSQVKAPGAVVVEGDRSLAGAFEKASTKRGLRFVHTHAEHWRSSMLLSREQRTGAQAKGAAVAHARRMAESAGLGGGQSIGDDAAEAMLLGTWAAQTLPLSSIVQQGD